MIFTGDRFFWEIEGRIVVVEVMGVRSSKPEGFYVSLWDGERLHEEVIIPKHIRVFHENSRDAYPAGMRLGERYEEYKRRARRIKAS